VLEIVTVLPAEIIILHASFGDVAPPLYVHIASVQLPVAFEVAVPLHCEKAVVHAKHTANTNIKTRTK
jgi:hypothetical protein